MAIINISGDIVSNDDKWIYDWFEYDSTCPKDVQAVIDSMAEGETLEVLINSGGGSVQAGQEIYSMMRRLPNVAVEIQSAAYSAAGIIAMAGKTVRMSPVAALMIHNVSVHGASGDYHDMEKNAELLKVLNASMANAYVEKTGMPLDEVLKLMDEETWLNANQCKEHGFVDEIISDHPEYYNAIGNMRITEEMRKKAAEEKKKLENRKEDILSDLFTYGI